MAHPSNSLLIITDSNGDPQFVKGKPANVGLREDLEIGQAWWNLLPDPSQAESTRSRFHSLDSRQRIQPFHLIGVNGKTLRAERILLAETEPLNGQTCSITLTLETNPAFDTQSALSSLTEAPYSAERFRLATIAASLVTWIYDANTGAPHVQGEATCILEFDFFQIEPTDEFWWSRVHPEDLGNMKSVMNRCNKPGTDEWDCEHRYLDASNNYRWVHEYGWVTRRFGGVGLGLTICRNSIELLGGTIQIESRVGEGTRFFGTIPYHKAAIEPTPASSSETAAINASARILIVDNGFTNRSAIRVLLKAYGAKVDEAIDGETALEMVSQTDYDIVFMDIHFPGICLLETTQLIRTNSNIHQPYIIAFTADVVNRSRSVCIQRGMNSHMSKPVSKEKLNRILREYLNDQEAFASN